MASIIHVLYLEDDPMDAELVRARLDEADLACRITGVQTRDEFERALGQKDASGAQQHIDMLGVIIGHTELAMWQMDPIMQYYLKANYAF
jgi:hypothetical protein